MSKIFSGDYSRSMWDSINKLKLQSKEMCDALYMICCRLQEFEDKLPTDKEPARFVKKSDCYVDTKTGLWWSLHSDGPMQWEDAMKYFLGGWRLPTIEELLTLVDYNKFKPASELSEMKPSHYWSSTTSASDTSDAWYVNFYNGHDYCYNKSYNYYVRAVHSEQE